MTGGLFTTPEERDALAGEYVFGTLDAGTAARVTAALATDAALREAVMEWEARLAPLSPDPPDGQARPGPDRSGWDGMEVGRPRIAMRPGPPRRNTRRFWKAWALGASALAAAFGLALLIPGLPETVSLAVLVPDRTQAAWIARVDRDGVLHLTRVAPTEAAAAPKVDTQAPEATPGADNRVLQAWVLPPGDAATNLGVLSRGAARVTLVRPPVTLAPGMLIGISQEPAGGSPSGQPTGPMVFMGRLSGAGGG